MALGYHHSRLTLLGSLGSKCPGVEYRVNMCAFVMPLVV